MVWKMVTSNEIITPELHAIQVFERLEEIFRTKQSTDINELRKRIRSRAREFPVLMEQVGMLSAFIHYLSKAELSNLNIVHNLWSDSKNKTSYIDKLVKSSKDKMGYAFYVYIILRYLTDSGFEVLTYEKEITTDNILNEILKKLDGLQNSIFDFLMHYLIVIKSLSEALYSDE